MDKIREIVCDFMEHQDVLTNLKDEKWYSVEDSLVELLSNNFILRRFIYDDMKYNYHKEDVIEELQYLNEEEPEKQIEMTYKNIDNITRIYENYLEDDDSWHTYLTEAINTFKENNNGN